MMDDPDHNTVWCAEWLGLGPWYGKLTRGGVGRVRFVGLAVQYSKLFVSILFCFVLFCQRFISLILLFKKGRGKPFWETQE